MRFAAPALLLACAAAAVTPALAQEEGSTACLPETPRVLLERFVASRCPACWQQQPPQPANGAGRPAWMLDWVVGTDAPDAGGTDSISAPAAFLEGAVVPAAARRVARSGALAADEAFTQSHPLAERTALALDIDHTAAWNGSIELKMNARFTAQRPLPAGLSGWIALAERLPAGTHGTPVDRFLVRAVAGPLVLEGLDKHPVRLVQPVPAPATGNPERFTAIGWVETARGRVIAVGRAEWPGCPLR